MKKLVIAICILISALTVVSANEQGDELEVIPTRAQVDEFEVIIVTAQRREQNLQDVPISVTAFTGDYLESHNIKSAADYLSLTPNVSFTEDGQSGSRGVGISVRGVNNLVTGENAFVNSIGIYLDEFSIASVPNQVANPLIPDMQRIEILRGPQGTYFGRNSVGGALNMVTNEPTDEFEGKINIGGESYERANSQFNLTSVLNLPVSDDFKFRAVLYYEDSGGLVDNICATGASQQQCPGTAENTSVANGAKDSGHKSIMGRLKGLWELSDQTSVSMTLIYADEDQGTDENVPSGILDIDSTDTFGISDAIDPGTGFWPDNRNKLSRDIDEKNKLESLVGIVKLTHQLNDQIVVKSITGAIDAEQNRIFDNDLTGGNDVLGRDNTYQGTSWSTELRLEGTMNPMDWVVGFLYANDEQKQKNNIHVRPGAELGHTINGTGLLPPFPSNLGLAINNKKFEVESFAVFGDISWYLTEDFTLMAGGRYTRDTILNEYHSLGIAPSCTPGTVPACAVPSFGFFNSFINIPRTPARNEESFTDFAPRIVAQYQINNDLSLYTTVSKGYKAGGTSLGNDSTLPGDPPLVAPYNEEVLWNYEAGFKSELFDHRLRLNASVFHLEWSDLQFESFLFLVPGDLGTNFERTINIEAAEASGVEIEFLAKLSEGLTFSGGAGYLTTEITSATTAELTGGFIVNLQGLELPKSPPLTTNLAAEYRWPIGLNAAWLRLEYIHSDGQYSDIEGVTNRQTLGPSPNAGLVRTLTSEFPYLSPDYDVLNFRAGYEMENISILFYIQNLTDEEYYTGTQENFGASGIRLRPHPRIFGGSISYNF